MLTLDSSGLFALLDRRDRNHARAKAALRAEPGPRLVPAAILAEIACMIEARLRAEVVDGFLADLQEARFRLDCGEEDFGRIRALMRRYADLPLGFSDAAVVACAERNGGKVLTFDVRDFGVVAREGTIEVLPG